MQSKISQDLEGLEQYIPAPGITKKSQLKYKTWQMFQMKKI